MQGATFYQNIISLVISDLLRMHNKEIPSNSLLRRVWFNTTCPIFNPIWVSG